MRLVFGYDQAVADWVQMQTPHVAARGFGACTAIGVAHDEVLLGGVVYHDFQPDHRSIQMSAASIDTRWLIGPTGARKSVLQGLFAYPFVQLGCERVGMIVPKKNKRARAFCEGFGFKREGVARRGFYPDDAILYGLLRSEWFAGPWAVAAGNA